MNIYELYFADEYFRRKVDKFVNKHRTSYVGAFKCIEVINAYKARIGSLGSKGKELSTETF